MVVLAVLPALYACRRQQFYRGGMLPAGAMTIACIAAFWLYERIALQ
jgi:hypothetical protein